ncbi:MAG TPA: MaoC family dehydratase N-terminal domain-containing protein [Pseudonocardia sp.]
MTGTTPGASAPTAGPDEALVRSIEAAVGVTHVGSRGLQITERLVRRYARAIGADAPFAGARSNGPRALVAPPTMLTAMMNWSDEENDGSFARDDGFSFHDDLPGVHLGKVRIMGGGEKTRFLRSVKVGMTVWRRSTLRAVRHKAGSAGRFLLLTFDTAYVDDNDNLLLTSTKTVIVR